MDDDKRQWYEHVETGDENRPVDQPPITLVDLDEYYVETNITASLSKDDLRDVPIFGSYDADEEVIKLGSCVESDEYDVVEMCTVVCSHEYMHHLIFELEGYHYSKYYDRLLKDVFETTDLFTLVHDDPDFLDDMDIYADR